MKCLLLVCLLVFSEDVLLSRTAFSCQVSQTIPFASFLGVFTLLEYSTLSA